MSLVYGRNLSDNRVTVFVCSPLVARHWASFFLVALQAVRKQQNGGDRRLFWLKEQYLQLYYMYVVHKFFKKKIEMFTVQSVRPF